VELATGPSYRRPSRLIFAAISAVFTIGYVAEMLGEDEEWLWDLSIGMLPEDGCLRGIPPAAAAWTRWERSSDCRGKCGHDDGVH
jgi:hypothetical protein